MHRDGDRLLQLLIFSEEFLVSASRQLVLIASLPIVHTDRRPYRLSDSVNNSEIDSFSFAEYVFRSLVNLISLEEGEVVTRFPWVNLRVSRIIHTFQCHVCSRSVVAMYMTFRRLRAWPRVVRWICRLRSASFCHFLHNKFHHLHIFHFR